MQRQTNHWPLAPLLSVCAAMMLVATVGIAAVVTSISAVARPLAKADPVTRRCPECGWIESQRELDANGAEDHAVRIHEFTVRMVDGSSRVFREESGVKWRLGESLKFIE